MHIIFPILNDVIKCNTEVWWDVKSLSIQGLVLYKIACPVHMFFPFLSWSWRWAQFIKCTSCESETAFHFFFLVMNICNFMNNRECIFMFQYCLCKMMLTVKDLTVCSLDLFWWERPEEVFHAKQSYFYSKKKKKRGFTWSCMFWTHYGMTVTAFKSPNLRLSS